MKMLCVIALMAGMAFAFPTTTRAPTRCPPCTPSNGFQCFEETGCEYKVFGYTGFGQDARSNWTVANAVCLSHNAHLASVGSVTEARYVANDLNGNGLQELHPRWLGLIRDSNSTGGFRWTDGTPYASGFIYFRAGEPNNMGGIENCVASTGRPRFGEPARFQWNDARCSNQEK